MTSVFDDPEKEIDDAETKEVTKALTEALKEARIAKGYSQMKITRETGIAQKTISEIESGGGFRMSNYIKIARALDLVPKITFKKRKSVRKV